MELAASDGPPVVHLRQSAEVQATQENPEEPNSNRYTLRHASKIPRNHEHEREEKREECDREVASCRGKGLPPFVESVGARKTEEGSDPGEKTDRPSQLVDHASLGDQ